MFVEAAAAATVAIVTMAEAIPTSGIAGASATTGAQLYKQQL